MTVKAIETEDMEAVKGQYNIPRDMQSCHTVLIDVYIIEGHMPIAAVEKILVEKPDIVGITLPGMPAGIPGMPGIKRGVFEVYKLNKDG